MKTETTHTPGPWEHDGAGRIHAGAFTVVAHVSGPKFVNKDIGAPYPEQAIGNAELIAQAPTMAARIAALEAERAELLAALQRVVTVYEPLLDARWETEECETMAMARAAIAKCEGKEER